MRLRCARSTEVEVLCLVLKRELLQKLVVMETEKKGEIELKHQGVIVILYIIISIIYNYIIGFICLKARMKRILYIQNLCSVQNSLLFFLIITDPLV